MADLTLADLTLTDLRKAQKREAERYLNDAGRSKPDYRRIPAFERPLSDGDEKETVRRSGWMDRLELGTGRPSAMHEDAK